uniref:Ovule protein n=1 Tax=Ascaris lumbricoides TaxID=6252 RepID=A0A0M3HJE5_ASCLU
MEDDNAVDIFKWIFASNIDDDLSDDLQLETASGIRNVHVSTTSLCFIFLGYDYLLKIYAEDLIFAKFNLFIHY